MESSRRDIIFLIKRNMPFFVFSFLFLSSVFLPVWNGDAIPGSQLVIMRMKGNGKDGRRGVRGREAKGRRVLSDCLPLNPLGVKN